MKRLTAIAISGGVDSLMAGYFLKAQGDDVVGIHFVTGYESMPRSTSHTPAENPLRPALPCRFHGNHAFHIPFIPFIPVKFRSYRLCERQSLGSGSLP